MSLRIATWNVNSLRQRMEHLARFTELAKPDVICLQEIKVQNDSFPWQEVRDIGYEHLLVHGQKSYNGVAVLSRKPFVEQDNWVWCERDDRRHAVVTLEGGLELHNFYVPSGGPVPDPEKNDKFAHKLRFLKEMAEWARNDDLKSRKAIIVGDLNVAPLEWDVWNHKRLLRSVGHTPVESALMQDLWSAGSLIDVGRHFVPTPEPLYSWWGYRFAQSLEKNYGWRLDHILATPALAGDLTQVTVYKETRSWEKPSDHVPLLLELG